MRLKWKRIVICLLLKINKFKYDCIKKTKILKDEEDYVDFFGKQWGSL